MLIDDDTKAELPLHIALGASDFLKIKSKITARIGKTGEPAAELTKLGWMIVSSGPDVQAIPTQCTWSYFWKLQRDFALFKEYDDKIKGQPAEWIVKEAPETATSKEFQIPPKSAVKQLTGTTKLRIVYGASAKPTKASPFLNECLEIGPALQKTLCNVLYDVVWNYFLLQETWNKPS